MIPSVISHCEICGYDKGFWLYSMCHIFKVADICNETCHSRAKNIRTDYTDYSYKVVVSCVSLCD